MDQEIEKSRKTEIERKTDGQHQKKSMWKLEEDMLLKRYVETYGEGKWSSISKKLGLLRDGKSCRLRWKNYLRPDIKHGGMSKDEEDLIIRMHKLLGNRWSLIAGRLPGRTDNEVKNYWNTHLSKKMARRAKRKAITSNVNNHENPEPSRAKRARFEQANSKGNRDRSTPESPNTSMDGAQEETTICATSKEEENWSTLTGDHLLMGLHTTQNQNWSFMDMDFMDHINENAFLVYGVDEDPEVRPWGSLAWDHASYVDLFNMFGSEFFLCDMINADQLS